MATSEEYTKIIDIQLKSSDLIAQAAKIRVELDALKQSQKELDAQNKAGTISKDQYTKATIANNEATKALNTQYRQVSKEIQSNIKVAQSAETSYNKLAAQYEINVSKLKAMTSEERNNTEAGKKLVENTKDIRAEMAASQAKIGDNTLSVGSYENAMNSVIGSQGAFISSLMKMVISGGSSKEVFSSLASSAGALLKQLLLLISNPIVATLVAITVSIKAISAAIKSSDELSDRWSVTMSKLQRVFDFFMLVLQKLVGVWMDYVDVVMKGFDYVINLLSKIPGKVGETFRSMKTNTEKAEGMAKRAVKLEDDMRAFRVESAKKELEIAELRAKAVDKEKYSATQRLGFLNSAIKIEKGMTAEKLALANEDYLIAKERANRNQASEDALDSLAEKEANLYKVQQESADFERSTAKQRNAAIGQIKEENKARQEKILLEKKLKAQWEDSLKTLGKGDIKIPETTEAAITEEETKQETPSEVVKSKLAEIQDRYNQEILLVQNNELEIQRIKIQTAQETLDYLNGLSDEQKDNETATGQVASAATIEAEKSKQEAIKKTAEVQLKTTEQQIGAAADMFGAMSQFMEEFAGQNESMVILSKALALVEIGLNTAKAVSGAIASAQSVPFPGNIFAIVTGITAVLSAMVQAKQALSNTKMPDNDVKAVKRPKFHTGGIVPGSGEVDATLLAGERVMTTKASNMFSGVLQSMELAASGNRVSLGNYQGGNGMEFFKEAFSAALRDMPSPTVSVVEFERVQSKIKIGNAIVKT